jgi:hypothetical protein
MEAYIVTCQHVARQRDGKEVTAKTNTCCCRLLGYATVERGYVACF